MELYGSIQSISGSMTASVFTGSFKGDGSGLYGISATGVTGLNLSQISTGSVTASVSPNGFNINSDTSITGTLRVNGTIVAEQIDVTIYSSSVLYQSGSTRFGDSLDDDHNITGSVKITGSISLNGQAIGTGKLDETTFQSYTSSNNGRVSALETSSGSLNIFSSSINAYTESNNNKVIALETSTSSLNLFTSSINTTIKNKLDNDGVISGSVQVQITGISGYSTFSSSIATTDSNQETRLNLLETSTGSLNTFSSSALSRLTNIETTTSSLNSFTNSASSQLNSLESASGSIRTDFNSYTSSNDLTNTIQNGRLTALETTTSSLNTYTSSANTKLSGIETATSSLNNFTSSINTTIKSKLDTDGVISGSGQIDITQTTNYTTFSSSLATTDLNQTNKINAIESSTASLNIYTSSTDIKLIAIETATGSLNSFTNSINTTIKSKLDADGVISGSVQVTLSNTTGYSTFSSSLATTDAGQDNRLSSIEGKTGSYATTGSNIFIGNQTITGSLYVSQDLIIAGSSSIQHISSSVVNIADNIITVNAQNPSIRFGGLAVIDSGSSPQVSGSILFDSTNDQWIFIHQNQSTVTSSILLMGPQTYNNLGSETYPTINRILKSLNAEHVGDSNITDTGTKVSINSNSEVTGTFIATGTVSGTNITSIEATTASLNSYTASNNTRLGLIETATGSLNSFTNSINTTIKNRLNAESVLSSSAQVVSALPAGTVSGSSQVLAGTTIHSGSFFNGISVVSGSAQVSFNGIIDKPTLVSGSSQITYSGISSIPSGIVSGSSQITFGSISSIPSGLVSGSSQIDLTATTNYSTGIKTRLNAEGVLSGSAQVVASLPSGTVSGSAQVSLTGTNGFGTYLNQAVLTTSSPTFAGVSATTFTGALSGNATTATSTGTLSSSGTLTTQTGSGTLIHSSAITSGTSGLFSTGDNSNSIITFNRHPGDYYSQLGFNSTGGVFYRSFNNAAINTSQGWQTVWTSSSLTNLNQLTNGPGYITGISFANVSSKPTTISGYGITDAITTSNISSQSVSNASTVANLTPIQFFNNMGGNHSTRTSFDASTPSYDFGFRYVQGSTNGPGTGGSQFYSWYIGLGNDYPATGSGSYGAMFAVDRNVTTPYLSVRYNENNSFGSWRRIHAGYADTAGNITAYTINQNLGTSNTVQFGSLGVGVSPALTVHFRGSNEMVRFENTSTSSGQYCQLNMRAGSRNAYFWVANENSTSWAGAGGLNIYTDNGNIDLWSNAVQRVRLQTDGHLVPYVNNAYDLGSASLGWRNVYTNDLHLSNMNKPEGNDVDGTNGNWTIQEGAENLYIINNNNGKKFKISLEEII